MPIPIDEEDMPYALELRQMPVPGLNARHYFWVLKNGLNEPVAEMHGFAKNPRTDAARDFSVGGEPLGFFDLAKSDKPEKIRKAGGFRFERSRGLPYRTVLIAPRHEVEARWAAGLATGHRVNKSGILYHLLTTNSNALATTLGRSMGFDPGKILDPRPEGGQEQPFAPGLGHDLWPDLKKPPLSEFRFSPEEVSGYGEIDRPPNPFGDPFRESLPR